MVYKVRVKDGRDLGGYRVDGSRLNILPGTYEVDIEDNGFLRFKSADTYLKEHLVVKLDEYIELCEFPDFSSNPYIELID